MQRRTLVLATAALLCSCSTRDYKVADPVVGPPPPRIPNAEAHQRPVATALAQVGYDEEGPLPMTAVAARVDGHPILVGDVLEQYAARLRQVRGRMSDKQYREAQEMLIKRDLPHLIEQTMMVNAVKSQLQQEQLDAIEEQLDKFFETEVDRLKSQFEVETTADLEALLQEQGMSLATMRKMFGERQLATEFMRGKVGGDPPITRKRLLAEYEANLSDYEHPAQVKWQQLQIVIGRSVTKAEARAKLQAALAELRDGASFDSLVREYSNGPLAASGGHWDWMQPESVAVPEVRQHLETLEIGQVSPIIETDKNLQVIMVHGRRPKRHTPFEEVQDDIRKTLVETHRKKHIEGVIADLKSQAVVETIFDGSSAPIREVSDSQ